MKVPAITALLLSLPIISCLPEDEPTAPAHEVQLTEGAPIAIGREWVYRRLFVQEGMPQAPDTMLGYSLSVCDGDTMIDGKLFYRIRETHTSVGMYDVHTSVNVQYVYPGNDSVIVYSPKDSGGVIVGIFKRRNAGHHAQAPIAPYVWRGQPYAHLASPQYDTSAFADRYCPLIYPLTESSSWYYRPDEGFSGDRPIVLRCRGRDTISVPAGLFAAWKVQWDWSFTAFAGVVDEAYDWITGFGFVRRYWDLGSALYTTRDGQSVSVSYYDIFEYCGDARETIPVLEPLLPPEAIDSALTAAWPHWSFDEYRFWYSALVHYCDTVTTYCFACDTGWGHVAASALAEAVWGDTLRSFSGASAYFDTATFPLTIDSLTDPSRFLWSIVDNDAFVQGWRDCDFNWSTSTAPLQQGVLLPYGNSEKRRKIAADLYDRFD